MNKFVFKLLLIFITPFITLFASQKDTDDIARISAVSLYNINKNGLQITIKDYIKNYPNLKAVKIVETLSGETYFSMYKENNKIFYNKEFPTSIKNLKYFKSISKLEGEEAGVIHAYFDETLLQNKIYKKEKKTALIVLSKEEKLWVKNHPIIKLAMMNYWAKDDKGDNIHTDVVKLLTKYSDLNIVPIKYETWKDGFNDTIEGVNSHGILNLSWSKERKEKYFHYTKPYNFSPSQLIVKKDNNDIKTIKDLKNKTVYIREKSITRKTLEDEMPSSKIVEIKDETIMFKMLSQGKNSEAILDYSSDKEKIEKFNLKIVQNVYDKYSQVAIGISHKQKPLLSILNKIYEIIPEDELFDLQNKVYKKEKKKYELRLTKEEENYIKNHKPIKVGGEVDWAPFDFVDISGEYQGIAKDYLNLISEMSGLKFNIITGDTWSELLSKFKNKKLDMLPVLYYAKDRESFTSYTKPYFQLNQYFFIRENEKNIQGIDSLNGKILSVIGGYYTVELLKKEYPKIKLDLVKNVAQCLNNVVQKISDACIEALTPASYAIEKNFLNGLKLGLKATFAPTKLYMGVNKEKTILRDIIDKSLKAITLKQRKDIIRKWVNIKPTNEKKELNIAFHFDRPPFMFGKTSSKGIEADLVKEILELKGYTVNIHQMSKSNMESISTDNTKFDGVSSVSNSNDGMFYSDDFISYENYAITRTKDNIKIDNLEDLTKVNFVAWKNAYNDLGEDFHNLFNPKNGKFKKVYSDKTSQSDQHKSFFNKEVKAIIVEKTIFQWYKLALKNKDKFTFHKIFPKITSYPAKFKSKKIKDDFNSGLKVLKENGRYQEIIDFYLNQDIRSLLKYSNLIADLSSKFVFSNKTETLLDILKHFFIHPDIVHIEVFDSASNKNFISLYKKNNQIINAEDNDQFHHLPNIIKKVYYTESGNPLNVGTVRIFYKKDLNLKQKKLIPPLNIFVDFDEDTFSYIEKSYKKFGFINSKIKLTNTERKWINSHTIKVGVEQWAPVVFSNTKKDIDGISGDIFKLVVERTGLNIEIINDLWNPLLKDFKDKKIDLLPATYYTQERATYGLYSEAYYKMLDYIYVKENNNEINSMNDLNGKTLAIPKGFGTIPKIRKKFPEIKIIETKDLKDSINRVLSGEVEALFDGQVAVEYKIQDELILGLKGISQNDYEAATLHFFSRNDEPILQSILQKGLESVTFEEKRKIISKWIGSSDKLKLSKKEQKWLDKKIPIRYVYDPDWAPFEWTNELEKHTGMIADVLNIVAEKSGIEFVPVGVEKWSDAVLKAKAKEVDMYSGINQTDEKSTYMQFTQKSIYQAPYVFVTRIDDTSDYFETFKALKNKKVGVVDGYSIHDTLKKEQPELPLIVISSTKKAFEKLQDKGIDVFVVNAATAKYYINRLGFENLRIATKTKYNLDLKVAIRKDWDKEVVSIIDKALNEISQKDLSDIYYKWTEVIVEEKTNWILIFQISGVGFLITLFVLYNNRKLKYAVEKKTLELRLLLDSFDENVIASKTDLKGFITYTSRAFCEISGYTQEEMIGSPQSLVRHPDMPKAIFQDLWQTIKSGNTWRGEIKNKRKDGSFYWVHAVIEPLIDLSGKIIGYSSIRQDITSQKEVEEKTEILNNQKNDLETMLGVFDKNINSSKSDLEGNIIYASKAFSKAIGYTIEELLGKPHSILRHPDMPSAAFKDMWETIQGGKTWRGEVKSLKKDGGFVWSDALIEPEFDDKGKIIRYSAIRQDITAKKEVEELSVSLERKVEARTKEISEVKLNLETVSNTIDDLIFYKDLDLKYIGVNRAFCEFIGVEEKDIIGKTDFDIMPYENAKQKTTVNEQLLKDGISVYTEDVIPNAKGELAVHSMQKHVLKNRDGIIYGMVGSVKDITKLKEAQEEISQNKLFLDSLLDSQEQIVITTDGKKLRSINKKFLNFFGLENMEEFTKDYDCICDKFEMDDTHTYLQKEMGELMWIDYVIKHDEIAHKTVILKGEEERVFSVTAAIMPVEDGTIKSAVFTDITELETQKKQTDSILSSVLLPMLITSKKTRKVVYANSFAERQYESTLDEIVGSPIDEFYTDDHQRDKILKEMKQKGTIENFETRFKTFKGNEFDAILSLIDIDFGGEECFLGVASDITKQKKMENEVRKIHKHTRDSIEYASLIQHALVPDNNIFRKYFEDYFVIWHPKDIVGGDIYLFEELNENECLLMVIDCTGHGVPGAFVTMLVKAIERQVISEILNSDDEVSPAYILSYFNKTMKKLLKQEDDESISNAGFDGGILYYNKEKNLIRYAGAETPLFYIQNDDLKVIKTDRHSIGYKKSDANYKFTNYEIIIDTQTQIYISTDGYFDQNGGDKSFPYGRRKFQKLINENHKEGFADQQEFLLYELQEYQGDEERNDDVTVVGLNVAPK